jgi:hypothetical protein
MIRGRWGVIYDRLLLIAVALAVAILAWRGHWAGRLRP